MSLLATWSPIWIQNLFRKKLLKATSHPNMLEFLNFVPVDLRKSVYDCDYLIADLEMTGLDSKTDHIVSAGWIRVSNGKILHSTAKHHYLKHQDLDLNQSAPIHKITHNQLENGMDAGFVFNDFLADLAGKILVLHHAPLDLSFINQLFKTIYGVELMTPTIDTMLIEKRKLERQNALGTSSLRLSDCRKRYNLPTYTAHNAAIDALATAELWLAQLAYSGDPPPRVRSYI